MGIKKEGEQWNLCSVSLLLSAKNRFFAKIFSFQSGRPFRRSLCGEYTPSGPSPRGDSVTGRLGPSGDCSLSGLHLLMISSPSGGASVGISSSSGSSIRRDCSLETILPSVIPIPSEVTPVGVPVPEIQLSGSSPPGSFVSFRGKLPFKRFPSGDLFPGGRLYTVGNRFLTVPLPSGIHPLREGLRPELCPVENLNSYSGSLPFRIKLPFGIYPFGSFPPHLGIAPLARIVYCCCTFAYTGLKRGNQYFFSTSSPHTFHISFNMFQHSETPMNSGLQC